MDLATFFKEYEVVITVLSGLVIAILSYNFGKWNSERNRKWEMEDREYKRRSEIHDMRVKEARDALDFWADAIHLLEEIVRILRDSSSVETMHKELDVLKDDALGLSSKVSEAVRKKASIDILNDDEIKSLLKELRLLAPPSIDKFVAVFDQLFIDDFLDVEAIRKEVDLDKFMEAIGKAEKIITKMKARLDKIAEKVP